MKTILYFWVIISLNLYTSSLQAEVLSIPGAKLKPLNNTPVTELKGCFFAVQYLGLEIPNDAIIDKFDLLFYNQSIQNEDVLIKIEKFKIFSEYLFNETINIPSGYFTFSATPDSAITLEPKEFLNIYTELLSSDLAVCGIRVHYLPDLIFINGF